MALHRVHLDAIPPVGEICVIEGDEAKHAARVKRLEPGNHLQLLDGRGSVARAVVIAVPPELAARRKHEWLLPVRVEDVAHVAPTSPALHVCSATPKGARLDDMIDAISQAGAARWSPLETTLGVVDPRDTKLSRIERVAVEASKQCGRAWVLCTGPRLTFSQALDPRDAAVVLADGSGTPYRRTGAASVRLLIGPEGGWTADELASARASGARVHTFGPHIMRIETASVVAAAIILAAEHT